MSSKQNDVVQVKRAMQIAQAIGYKDDAFIVLIVGKVLAHLASEQSADANLVELLRSIREPTPEMCKAGVVYGVSQARNDSTWYPSIAEDTWKAMIDAAIAQREGKD